MKKQSFGMNVRVWTEHIYAQNSEELFLGNFSVDVRNGGLMMDYQEAIKTLQAMYDLSDHPMSEISMEEAEAINIAISAMQELQEYRKLGTLEEVRYVVEKQRAKEPLLGGNTDKLTGDIRICPYCSGVVGVDDIRTEFCADCGQAIDWSDEEKHEEM